MVVLKSFIVYTHIGNIAPADKLTPAFEAMASRVRSCALCSLPLSCGCSSLISKAVVIELSRGFFCRKRWFRETRYSTLARCSLSSLRVPNLTVKNAVMVSKTTLNALFIVPVDIRVEVILLLPWARLQQVAVSESETGNIELAGRLASAFEAMARRKELCIVNKTVSHPWTISLLHQYCTPVYLYLGFLSGIMDSCLSGHAQKPFRPPAEQSTTVLPFPAKNLLVFYLKFRFWNIPSQYWMGGIAKSIPEKYYLWMNLPNFRWYSGWNYVRGWLYLIFVYTWLLFLEIVEMCIVVSF